MSGYYTNPDLDNIWFSSSADDGKHWNQAAKSVPRASTTRIVLPDGKVKYDTDGYYFNQMSAVRTDDDLMFVAIEHINDVHDIDGSVHFLTEPTSGARAALVIVQYAPAGASTPDKSSVIFKGVKPDLI
jgi:hypothetical protein